MRLITLALAVLLALVHAQLWLGGGGLPRVMDLQAKLRIQNASNDAARQRNDQLIAEVSDLREGLEMVEEKARSELGMVKPDELLVQIIPTPAGTGGGSPVAPPPVVTPPAAQPAAPRR